MELEGRTFVVTGGTGALGTAVVAASLAGGARCRVPYRNDAEADAFPYKDRVTLVPRCDLTSEADVARLYDGITDLWASIHIAGAFAMGTIADTDKAALMRMLDANFVSAYLCCRAAVRTFGAGGGRIVNVSSRPGLEPRLGAGISAYTAPIRRARPQSRRSPDPSRPNSWGETFSSTRSRRRSSIRPPTAPRYRRPTTALGSSRRRSP
jgi:NAD(P)-dependent dehydrogenase (short-subunit alcohol dehydrogenase family)